MTKLGTPIGAGPNGAIVVVGLARVGAPPGSNWAPPSPSSASGWSPPPVALGAAYRAVALAAAARVAEAFVVGDAAADVGFRFRFERFAAVEFFVVLLAGFGGRSGRP